MYIFGPKNDRYQAWFKDHLDKAWELLVLALATLFLTPWIAMMIWNNAVCPEHPVGYWQGFWTLFLVSMVVKHCIPIRWEE